MYPITFISDIKSDHTYLILENSSYRESSGYEKEGEFGSLVNTVNIYPCSEKKLSEYVIELQKQNKQFRVIQFRPCEVKTTIHVEVK